MKLSYLVIMLVVFVTGLQAQITWDVSVKFILDENGNRATSGNYTTDQEILDSFDLANEQLAAMARGYEFEVIEIIDLPGVSEWFDSSCTSADAGDLQAAAEADTAAFAWKTSAINVYVLGTDCSAVCSFPSTGDIILVGQGAALTSPFHESGHFFDLCHTQGCSASDCDSTSDEIADTLPDASCWDQDGIAQESFGVDYDQLSTAQKDEVDDVWLNIMSYHNLNQRERLTPDQLDRLTDASNIVRANVASGQTWYVESGGFPGPMPFPFGLLADLPLDDLSDGLSAAAPKDVVLLRPGTYDAPSVIDQCVMLCASHGGVVLD